MMAANSDDKTPPLSPFQGFGSLGSDSFLAHRIKAIEDTMLRVRRFDKQTLQKHGLVIHLYDSESELPTELPLKNRKFKSEECDYIAIPYWRLDGTPLMHNLGGADRQYCRWRKHNHIPKKYRNKEGKEKETGKYATLDNTAPHAYFCKTIDWMEVAKDINVPICFVESEFAAITCNEHALLNHLDVRFIAIGGHQMLFYQGKKRTKLDFIAPFDDTTFLLAGRVVYFLYDVDVGAKEDPGFSLEVMRSIQRQNKELMKRGALPMLLCLSQTDLWKAGEKLAPDDYFNAPDGKGTWLKLIKTLKIIEGDIALQQVQARFAVLKDSGDLLDLETGKPKPISKFLPLVGLYGYGADQKAQAAFLIHRDTAYITSTVMTEAVPFGLGVSDAASNGRERIFNAWKGLALEPGEPLPYVLEEWERLLKLNHGDNWAWVEGYLAHMVQHPLELPGQGLLTISRAKGIGKSCHTFPLHQILGSYARMPEDRSWGMRFDDSYLHAILIQVNEGSIRTPFAMRLLKTRITEPWLDIEPKGIQTMRVVNKSRTILNGNSPEDFCGLEPERRVLVSKPAVDPNQVFDLRGRLNRLDPTTGKSYYLSLKDDPVWARAILTRLSELNFAANYKPGEAAPDTEAADELEDINETAEQGASTALYEYCDGVVAFHAQIRSGKGKAIIDEVLKGHFVDKVTKQIRCADGVSRMITIMSRLSRPPFKIVEVPKSDRNRPTKEYGGDLEWLKARILMTEQALNRLMPF